MKLISIGVETVLEEDVVYALPTLSCEIEVRNSPPPTLETSVLEDSGFIELTAAIVTGAFIRCTDDDAIVYLRKNNV